ncbi:Molybdenum cofactor guanylyltransferase [Andreprevotia sp. IGB-42]|uniref:molybdenum cofactor guanylyltransferase MobA n=1 Tax=Andreprevotia sp. IGB-42 TaxID=2497473 RepID=UPI0013579199|nr:molybdenum cofactor guanylyltransferase MobA [Andreprevotia sp. IGB-42]KAF0815378.1 Molybdenum cofactor guanylyltransferase [Andreprevotia sp. IGB-42]
MTERPDVLILCGGEGRRMGGQDKGLVLLDGVPLYRHVLNQLDHQLVGQVWISANRNLACYQQHGHTVLTDTRSGFCGPLAGIEAGLLATCADYLLVLPCDVPQLPGDLATQLWQARSQAAVVRACNAERAQPLACLIHRATLPVLQAALDAGHYSVMQWQALAGVAEVMFDAPFTNINDAATLAAIAPPLAMPA